MPPTQLLAGFVDKGIRDQTIEGWGGEERQCSTTFLTVRQIMNRYNLSQEKKVCVFWNRLCCNRLLETGFKVIKWMRRNSVCKSCKQGATSGPGLTT